MLMAEPASAITTDPLWHGILTGENPALRRGRLFPRMWASEMSDILNRSGGSAGSFSADIFKEPKDVRRAH